MCIKGNWENDKAIMSDEGVAKVVNQEALEQIEELLQKYKYNWGKEVELNNTIPGMAQEQLVVVLERIVETGESVLVGWDKCFSQRKL